MATFIDLGFMYGLSPIFVFLMTFAIVYVLLQGVKILGTSKSMHAIIAFVSGIFVAMSSNITKIIMSVIPWFALIMFFLILLVLGFGAMGAGKEELLNTLGSSDSPGSILFWAVVVIALIILGGAIADVYGQKQLEITDPDASVSPSSNVSASSGSSMNSNAVDTGSLKTDTGDFGTNLGNALYHPRMLGFILVMLIGVLTVAMLTKSS